MATVEGLRRRLTYLQRKAAKPAAPRHWIIALVGEQPVPAFISRSFRSGIDTLFVKRIHLDGDEWQPSPMSCTVLVGRKVHIVDVATGKRQAPAKRVDGGF